MVWPPLAETDGAGSAYHLGDALGSIRGLTDDTGAMTGTAEYSVFGEVRGQAGASSHFGFTGEWTDATTGFTHLRARDLDPSLGRFLSVDTVQPNAPGTQGFNVYAYVGNNPTTWVDPSGHLPQGLAMLLGLNPAVALAALGIMVVLIFLYVAWLLQKGLLELPPPPSLDWDPPLRRPNLNDLPKNWPNMPFKKCAVGAIKGVGSGIPWGLAFGYGAIDLAIDAGMGCFDSARKGKPGNTAGPNRHMPFDDETTKQIDITVERMRTGKPKYDTHDGKVFDNKWDQLPKMADPEYYIEWTVDTPGLSGRGGRRMVVGKGGEYYYFPNHFEGGFIPFNPGGP